MIQSAGYSLIQWAVGAARFRSIISQEYLADLEGRRVLDFGCGPAEIRDYLPTSLEYFGIDVDPEHINRARRRMVGRGQFSVIDPHEYAFPTGEFDCIIALGVLHHMTDRQVGNFLMKCREALVGNGYLFTVDPCYTESMNPIARYLIDNDQGEHVRGGSQYRTLLDPYFSEIETWQRTDLLRVPYSHFLARARIWSGE